MTPSDDDSIGQDVRRMVDEVFDGGVVSWPDPGSVTRPAAPRTPEERVALRRARAEADEAARVERRAARMEREAMESVAREARRAAAAVEDDERRAAREARRRAEAERYA
jgi:hypothetical protein